jgi:hypothetical protein
VVAAAADHSPPDDRLGRQISPTAILSPASLQVPLSVAARGWDLRTRDEIEMRLRRAEERDVEDQLLRMSYGARIRWAGANEERLRLVARACGYRAGWVWHQLRDQSHALAGGVDG